jgi:hypothetical protein
MRDNLDFAAYKLFAGHAHQLGSPSFAFGTIMRQALAGLALVLLAAFTVSHADSLTEFSEAESLAMQADMKAALPHLLRVQADGLPEKKRATLSCMRERFVDRKAPATPGVDAWTAEVLAVYRRYWTRVMLGTASMADGERELAASLAKKVRHQQPAHDMGALEPLLQKQLDARGYHALFGVTQPLREFMLWRKQTDETYDIDLPQGREAVHVTMMDDFVSLGWLGYAVCDHHHTGGWATSERLFAVRSAYDLDSEDFHVSYLAHEGQHFSDYRRFPGMEQPDLEYRAKLVEISKARTTLFDLLAEFGANGSDSREQPHPWANRQVVRSLAAKLLNGAAPSPEAWRRPTPEQLNTAAAELLEQDSRQRAAVK